MPKNTESLNRTLFELLHSKGLDPTMLSTSGKEIPTPEEAEVFQFNFIKDEEDYGTVTISIDGLHKLTVYFSDDVANSEKEESESDDVSWYQLLNQLKRFSQKYQLSFELRNVSNLKHDMAKREYMKKKESIAEGYYPMGKKASYSDAVPSVKIVLQHSRQIEEGEQRYRNVERIFLENEQGERFLAPTIRPGIARVYARHIAEGGKPHDDRWNHIGSLCEEYSKMAGFVRATRNGQFTESTQKLIAEGINHYQSLRESLGRLAGHRGYNAYFESWSPPLMEDESDMSNINELFVQETVDPRIENVMPILSKLQKKISEMSEVNELSEWADKLIEGDEDIEDNEADDAADNAESELTEAPGAETLGHNVRTDAKNMRAFDLEETHPAVRQLKNKLGQVAKQNPGSGLGKHYDNIKNGMTYKDLVRKGMVDQNGKIDIPGFKDEMEEAVRAGFVTPDWKHTPQQGAYGAPTDQLGRPYNQTQRDELAASVKQNRKDNKAFSGGLPTKGADSAAFGWDGVWKAPDVKNTAVRAQQDTGTDNPKKWKTLASAGDGKGIAEEESLTSNNPQGVPESEEHSPVAQAITRKILTQRTDLLKKYGPVKVMQAIDSASEFFGDVEEIGSSDMYAYMQYVEKELGNVDEGMMDTVEKGVKALDRFVTGGDKEDLLKDLQKKAGIPSDAQHGKPNMAKPREEEVDESALQAWLGDKKYGEDGMDALRKAGQEHASEKEMQNIRAHYSKKEEPVKEDGEFAGNYATGEAGQWRNKGPKANKPATIGDLVGEGQDDLDTIKRLVRK